jgi:hypothetical protein
MIYLASPYSAKIHDGEEAGQIDEVLQHKRYIEACLAAGFLMKLGELAYSPIAHWHVIDKLFNGTIGYEDYLAADMNMIDLCREVHVLCIDGWDKSRGVLLEIEYAKMKGKPVQYFKTTEEGIHYVTLS